MQRGPLQKKNASSSLLFADNEHLWLYMNLNTIVCKLITLLKLLCVNFSPVTWVLPTFGRININERKVAAHAELLCPRNLCVPPQVLEVRAKKRTGGDSLVTALRNTLQGHYPDKSLALGGTFIIQKGKAKIHIMVNTGCDTKLD